MHRPAPLPLLITRKRKETTRKMTPMMMMMKNRKTVPVTRYIQCLVSLRLSSHPGDEAAEGIATKTPLAVVDLLYDVSRREPRAAAGVGL